MNILFASGKGGAGKTTVTAGLSAFWPRPFVLADADVEAPDLGLYLPHHFTSCLLYTSDAADDTLQV